MGIHFMSGVMASAFEFWAETDPSIHETGSETEVARSSNVSLLGGRYLRNLENKLFNAGSTKFYW